METLIAKPAEDEYADFYAGYINLINTDEIFTILANQKDGFRALIQNVPVEKAGYRYAENKWSVKEVIGHVIDSERVMAYRALAISRGEQQNIPGFNENEYVLNGNFQKRTLQNLAKEFDLLRASNISLFKSFDQDMLLRSGMANDYDISVRALIYIVAGHLEHHVKILKERYFIDG